MCKEMLKIDPFSCTYVHTYVMYVRTYVCNGVCTTGNGIYQALQSLRTSRVVGNGSSQSKALSTQVTIRNQPYFQFCMISTIHMYVHTPYSVAVLCTLVSKMPMHVHNIMLPHTYVRTYTSVYVY